MKIDLQGLRATTAAAIQTAEAVRVARLAAEEQAKRTEAERIRRETDARVEFILGQVPGRCATEASAGRSHAIVMSLASRWSRGANGIHDYENSGAVNANTLVGPGKIVYDNLVASGLGVTIEYWHDGVGVESGYNLVVHW